MLLSFQLLLAHLLNHFALQAFAVSNTGRSLVTSGRYAVGYITCALLCVNWSMNGRAAAAILALAMVHTAIDFLERRLTDELKTFLVAQGLHMLSVFMIAAWTTAANGPAFSRALRSLATSPLLYLYGASYVMAVFGGSTVVQKVARAFMAKIHQELTPLKPGLPEAGRYIGYLERFLILTFVLAQNYEAIGFLLAAKALVRYPEITEDKKGHFAEYFLVGTLTSFGVALIVGAGVRFVITHLGPS